MTSSRIRSRESRARSSIFYTAGRTLWGPVRSRSSLRCRMAPNDPTRLARCKEAAHETLCPVDREPGCRMRRAVCGRWNGGCRGISGQAHTRARRFRARGVRRHHCAGRGPEARRRFQATRGHRRPQRRFRDHRDGARRQGQSGRLYAARSDHDHPRHRAQSLRETPLRRGQRLRRRRADGAHPAGAVHPCLGARSESEGVRRPHQIQSRQVPLCLGRSGQPASPGRRAAEDQNRRAASSRALQGHGGPLCPAWFPARFT